MGKGQNKAKRERTAANKLVTREHMVDYVDERFKDLLTAYHYRKWYRRLWRWIKGLVRKQ